MTPGLFEGNAKYTSMAELEARCVAAQAANWLLGSFVLSIFPPDVMLPLLAAMRETKVSSVRAMHGVEVDLTAQVSSEFLMIVDEIENLYRARAGEQGREN